MLAQPMAGVAVALVLVLATCAGVVSADYLSYNLDMVQLEYSSPNLPFKDRLDSFIIQLYKSDSVLVGGGAEVSIVMPPSSCPEPPGDASATQPQQRNDHVSHNITLAQGHPNPPSSPAVLKKDKRIFRHRHHGKYDRNLTYAASPEMHVALHHGNRTMQRHVVGDSAIHTRRQRDIPYREGIYMLMKMRHHMRDEEPGNPTVPQKTTAYGHYVVSNRISHLLAGKPVPASTAAAEAFVLDLLTDSSSGDRLVRLRYVTVPERTSPPQLSPFPFRCLDSANVSTVAQNADGLLCPFDDFSRSVLTSMHTWSRSTAFKRVRRAIY